MTGTTPHRRPLPVRRAAVAAHWQRGVYALEWAIIFPVFFMLLYAIVSYGLTFLVRESMQFAVEEGARAALRYPSSAVLGSSPPTWAHRSTEARQTAARALNWLPLGLRPGAGDIKFTVCHVSDADCSIATAMNPAIVCNASTPCLVLLSYRIDNYPASAIAPAINLPPMNLLLPGSLEARASTLADRRML